MIRLADIKEGYKELRLEVIKLIQEAEVKFPGRSGDQKRQWIIDTVDSWIHLPDWADHVLDIDGRIITLVVNTVCDYLNILSSDFSDVDPNTLNSVLDDVPYQTLVSLTAESPGDTAALRAAKALKAPAPPAVSYDKDAAFGKAMNLVMKSEGGWANHPKDKGGKTRYGITEGTLAAAYSKGIVSYATLGKLTPEDAKKIYYDMFYSRYGWDKVQWFINYLGFDATVNHGIGGAARIFQSAMNTYAPSVKPKLVEDGKWGPKTEARLLELWSEEASEKDLKKFASIYLLRRKKFYDGIISNNPSQRVFLKGWYNRLNFIADNIGVDRVA